ncbi:MAG: CPP1-like family protein [Synechococcales bacterium]|nr:CPP1-like family protein [Synechococcales bacterium]
MSTQSNYEKLGVDENSSFEEIQDARQRLLQECNNDRKQMEEVEAAYDAILMDRLRLRQEGKIKVPDRIRFPERLVDPPPQPVSSPTKQAPDWLQRFIDNPSQSEILWPALSFLGVGALGLASPPVALALGVGFSLYFLNRKENKFGRAFLITLVTLIIGVTIGLQLGAVIGPQLKALNLEIESFAALVTAFWFWLVSSFLR